MASHDNLQELLVEYKRQVEAQWDAIPEYEGDILNVAGIRDDIHTEYAQLPPGQVKEELAKQIREIDARWQQHIKATKVEAFKMDYPKAGNHWWYNLDKLDDQELNTSEL